MLELRSDPQRFVLELPPGWVSVSRTCTFAIPAGTWWSGRWEVVGCIPSGTPFAHKRVGTDTLSEGGFGGERYTVAGAVGEATLRAIEAAAGGPFTVEMTDLFAAPQPEGAVDAVISFVLTLAGVVPGSPAQEVGGAWTSTYYLPERTKARERNGVRQSAFGIGQSAFGIRQSAFGIRHSEFGIGQSALGNRHWGLGIRGGSMMGVELVANLFNDPKTLGSLPDADSVGRVGMSGEGPHMAIYLRLDQDVIRDARFETYGCPYAVACGSWVTQWVVGRTAAAARALEAADLVGSVTRNPGL